MAEKIPRRTFFKIAATLIGASFAASCAPKLTNLTPLPDYTFVPTPIGEIRIDGTHLPAAEFLSIATRYEPSFFETIANVNQRDIVASITIENEVTRNGGFAALQAKSLAEGNVIGAGGCVDSRVCLPTIFPQISTSQLEAYQLLQKEGIVTPVYKIGAQPAVFQKGITQSIFVTHQTADCLPGGCGLLAGLETIVNDPMGKDILKNVHGVSDATLTEMQRLIDTGVTNAEDWAKLGARMQAELNFKAYGVDHYTAYGVYGHADNSFNVKGVIDRNGTIYPIENFPLLNSYSQYMNQPHPIIEKIAEGQKPIIVTLNGSRIHNSSTLFGQLATQQGVTFASEVDRIPGTPISMEEASRAFAGVDYGVGALKNQGVLVITADNATDLATLRNFVLTEGIKTGSIEKFIKEGGIIVGMIADETGKFRLGNIVQNETLVAEISKLKIIRSGVFQAARRAEFIEIIKSNKLGKTLSESQLLRLSKYYELARPFIPFLKVGLQVIGDYFTILDVVRFVDQDLMGHNLIYENVASTNNAIFSDNYHKMTLEEYQSIQNQWSLNYPGANPYAVSGLVGININQGELCAEYLGAWNGWMTSGPTAPQINQTEPWTQFKNPNDLGKIVTLNIPVEFPNARGEVTRPPIKLFTSLIVKPGLNPTGEYTQFSPKTINDPDQSMMLIDDMTGQFTSLSVEDGPIQFLGTEESGFQYLMEAVPSPETKSFEIRFVAPLGYKTQASLKDVGEKISEKLESSGDENYNINLTSPPGYTPPDIASYEKEYGKLGRLVMAMDKVLAALS